MTRSNYMLALFILPWLCDKTFQQNPLFGHHDTYDTLLPRLFTKFEGKRTTATPQDIVDWLRVNKECYNNTWYDCSSGKRG